MLHIVASNDTPTHRIGLARRHIETAIAHINDVAQCLVPPPGSEDSANVDELRLVVRALADIREALRSPEWSASAPPAASPVRMTAEG
jgi:hypothetical protein